MKFRAVIFSFACGVSCLASHAQTTIPRPDHVVIVIEENHGYSQIIGAASAPYINSLAQQGALFTQSFAIRHPSQPNYIALFSGSLQGITSDSCPHSFTGANLGSELIGAGFTFAGYSESMPSVGYTGCRSGSHTRSHNPWVDFTNLPESVNLRFEDFPTDFSALPTLAIVVPDKNNDMHDGSVREGDTWLREHIDAYVQWAKTHNSLLILTWDEGGAAEKNRIATIFAGPMVQPAAYCGLINHYNVLRTIEEMFGLPALGESAAAVPMENIWTTPGTSLQVNLESPSEGASVASGSTVRLSAAVSDVTADITRVEFFDGFNRIGETLAFPFNVDWTAGAAGEHCLNVRAINARGEIKSSPPVSVTVGSQASPSRANKDSYAGLFFDPAGVALESSGLFTATTRSGQSLAAKIQLAGERHFFRVQFDSANRASNSVARAGANPLTVLLELNPTNIERQITGSISDGNWTAQLVAERAEIGTKANPVSSAGRYTLIFPGSDSGASSPAGAGFANIP